MLRQLAGDCQVAWIPILGCPNNFRRSLDSWMVVEFMHELNVEPAELLSGGARERTKYHD